jgi:16S rRNA (guanine1207-N2)-methyltransferase
MELHGDVLDFASGAGVIGACIGAQQPQARVTLLDSNALALRACAETLASNALTGTIMASDGLAELSGSFDFIVSNPPIHTGIKTDSQLSIRLLEGVHEYIRPGGALILVANVHLPYEKWLKKTFKRCTQKTSDNHYKVILADR